MAARAEGYVEGNLRGVPQGIFRNEGAQGSPGHIEFQQRGIGADRTREIEILVRPECKIAISSAHRRMRDVDVNEIPRVLIKPENFSLELIGDPEMVVGSKSNVVGEVHAGFRQGRIQKIVGGGYQDHPRK